MSQMLFPSLDTLDRLVVTIYQKELNQDKSAIFVVSYFGLIYWFVPL